MDILFGNVIVFESYIRSKSNDDCFVMCSCSQYIEKKIARNNCFGVQRYPNKTKGKTC